MKKSIRCSQINHIIEILWRMIKWNIFHCILIFFIIFSHSLIHVFRNHYWWPLKIYLHVITIWAMPDNTTTLFIQCFTINLIYSFYGHETRMKITIKKKNCKMNLSNGYKSHLKLKHFFSTFPFGISYICECYRVF